jgi:hypothetical protein
VIPLDQTTPYNCMTACIASVLELPIRAVPFFIAGHDGRAWVRARAWLAARGLEAVDVPHGFGPRYTLFRGYSPRGTRHCVVAYDGEIVHDPHPTHVGLVSVDHVTEIRPVGCRSAR